ncbi:hypothetical protein F5Y04DRAFT_285458 [Hypomontagnella monticulosa]|nr:hypothetical protein F5Y04DRAFT_285458 [Hypomontagnella monticulosa]
MPKQVAHPSHQLYIAECKIEQLVKKISDLAAENQQLKAIIGRHGLPVPEYRATTPASPTSSQAETRRGFMKPTKSSCYHSVHYTKPMSLVEANTPTKPTSVLYRSNCYSQPTIFQWIDGVPVAKQIRGGYKEPTLSSVNKCRPALRTRPIGGDGSSWGDDIPLSDTYTDLASDHEESEDEQMDEQMDAQVIDTSLATRSQLYERFPTRLSAAPIESKIKYDLLKRSLCLAQEVLYNGAKKWIPTLAEVYSGPHEVVFGCDEVAGKLLPYVPYIIDNIAGRRDILRSTLHQEILGVTGLRNRVCHFSPHDGTMQLSDCDDYIRSTQELAVFFGDERAAFEARCYRANLIACAEEAIKEIENLHALTELPEAHPWKKYHTAAFQQVMRLDHRHQALGSDIEVDPVILRAARDWGSEQPHSSDEMW